MPWSRKGMRRIVVDGVEYYWRCRTHYESMCIELGIVVGPAVHGQHDREIRAGIALDRDDVCGWWSRVVGVITPRHVRRAIEVARDRLDDGPVLLRDEEAEHIVAEDLPSIEDELITAATALHATTGHDDFVRAWLSIGCRGGRDDLIDDWIASHANALGDGRLAWRHTGVFREYPNDAYRERSALAFVIERCARVGVAPPVDLAEADAQLAVCVKRRARPWGIPASHVWWTGQ